MGASVDDFRGRNRQAGVHGDEHVTTTKSSRGTPMKLRVVTPLALAAIAAAIGFAPIAAADTTVHQNQGNAEITAQPGTAATEAAQLQQPFGGASGALLFHHGR